MVFAKRLSVKSAPATPDFLVLKMIDDGTGFFIGYCKLGELLGYAKWDNFVNVIEKAKISCKKAGFEPSDHFARISKMVPLGSGANREIDDIALTRYACY